LRHFRRYRGTVAWIITWLVIGGTAAYSYTVAEANRKAVCTLRGDLKRRVESGNKFLRANPHGGFGFTPSEIMKSIGDQKRTIKALSGVTCSKEEEDST
jgi:hypothetical protein